MGFGALDSRERPEKPGTIRAQEIKGRGRVPFSSLDRIYDPSYGGVPTEETDWRPVEVKYEDQNIVRLELPSGTWIANPHSDLFIANPEQRNVRFTP